jgi:hypothetical protein
MLAATIHHIEMAMELVVL